MRGRNAAAALARTPAWMCGFLLPAICLPAALASARPILNAEDAERTSSLYTYHRTETELTTIDVSEAPKGQGMIDPRIFSNFLEHLGGSIYNGLWANVIGNPQFEPDKQGRLERWNRDPHAEWEEAGLMGRSVLLSTDSAVSQLTNLPIHRQRRYAGSVWARSDSAAPALLEITLRRQDKPAVLAIASMPIGFAEWTRAPFELRIPPAALDRGEAVEVRFSCVRGSVRLDMVELFPADHVRGVDPDVLRLAKDLRIELLRWPGGNFVSGYHWRDGIGPREKRPTKPNPAWAGLETHHFGTDEYMEFCRAIGAKPMICVNAGDGSPEEAADWVEYCNGAADTPMGRLRAGNGHPKPYNVRVWEIGNELYGDWQIGHTDPAGNAERYLRFRKAMLSRDPTIEIIATGRGDAFLGAGLAAADDWNEALLTAARSESAEPQYLSLHPLVPLPGGLARFSYEEVFESAMAHPAWWSETYLPRLRSQIQSKPRARKAQIAAAVTEWGIILGGPQWLRFPNHDAQSGAVYAGLFYNALIRGADMVRIANVTALMHGGGIKRANQVALVDPMYYVERMFGQARPARRLAVKVAGPGTDAPARGYLPGVRDLPLLDVTAGQSARQRFIFIVNRDSSRPHAAEIRFANAPKHAALEQLAADPRARNTPENPDSVSPTRQTVRLKGKTCMITAPPCSVSVLSW